jgi:arginyl-tRNA synthetase
MSSDYKFDWDIMLAMDGNTAPYMLYAYARIRSIEREAGIAYEDIPHDTPIVLEHESEIRLAKALLRLPDVLGQLARDYKPNVLTDYLFDLSKAYNIFYDRKRGVRVKDAFPEPVRLSRLRLCDLTARSLKLGLHLLGIGTLERM